MGEFCYTVLKFISITCFGPCILVIAIVGGIALNLFFAAIMITYAILLLVFTLSISCVLCYSKSKSLKETMKVLKSRVPQWILERSARTVQTFNHYILLKVERLSFGALGTSLGATIPLFHDIPKLVLLVLIAAGVLNCPSLL